MDTRARERMTALFAKDEAHRCCTIAHTRKDTKAICRLRKSGLVAQPYYRVYARAEYWNSLSPPEQMRHLVRAVHKLHPQWVFGRESALSMYNIEQPHALYETHELVILSDQAAQPSDHAHLCRLPLDDSLIVSMNGIRIANMHKTLFDCGLTFDFPDALAIYDSAVRRGLDISGILTLCKHAKQDTSKVQRLVEHTNPLAENGGESKARGVIINMGFMPPKLQQNFTNPNNLDVPLRTDFLWYGPNGSIIVGEYDGMQKYGTEYSQISEHVARQSERDKALIKQGVTRIVHFTYTDVMNPSQLRYKLEQAGVPYSDPHVYARH